MTWSATYPSVEHSRETLSTRTEMYRRRARASLAEEGGVVSGTEKGRVDAWSVGCDRERAGGLGGNAGQRVDGTVPFAHPTGSMGDEGEKSPRQWVVACPVTVRWPSASSGTVWWMVASSGTVWWMVASPRTDPWPLLSGPVGAHIAPRNRGTQPPYKRGPTVYFSLRTARCLRRLGGRLHGRDAVPNRSTGESDGRPVRSGLA